MIALDKTGTLTANSPTVVAVAATAGHTREQVLAVAAALEARSEHPLARAILAAVDTMPDAADVQAFPGAGLTGVVQGRAVRLGRPGWITAGDLAGHVQQMQEAGATAVLVEDDGQVIGAIAVRDELRPEAPAVVAELHRQGYAVTMLTGDNAATAHAVGAQAGITGVHAELRPEDKSTLVAALRTKAPTAMVGDGVNDAPALARADIGIAIGSGTDVAMESADIVLMHSDLRDVPTAIRLSHRTMRNIKQNLFWAFGYNVIGIPVAAGLLHLFGGPLLSPMLAAAAMSLSSVSVLTNALRLRRFH